MAWIDASQCPPVPGRKVHVWGCHTPAPWPLPSAVFDRRHGWSGTEWRASVGITHWWDGPKHPTRPPASSGVTTRFHTGKRARKVHDYPPPLGLTAPPPAPPPRPRPDALLRQRLAYRRDRADPNVRHGHGFWWFPAALTDAEIAETLAFMGFRRPGTMWGIPSAFGGRATAGPVEVRRYRGGTIAVAHQVVEFLYA